MLQFLRWKNVYVSAVKVTLKKYRHKEQTCVASGDGVRWGLLNAMLVF